MSGKSRSVTRVRTSSMIGAVVTAAALLLGCGDDGMGESQRDDLLDACQEFGHTGCHGAVQAFDDGGCTYQEALAVLSNAARGVYGTPASGQEASVGDLTTGAGRLCESVSE